MSRRLIPKVRRYAVELTTRETFTAIVDAKNGKEAATQAREGYWIETWAHGDRQVTGVKRVVRAERE